MWRSERYGQKATETAMVFTSRGAMKAGAAATVLAALASPSAVKAFGLSPGAVTTGHVNILGTASSTSPSLKADYASRGSTGEGSSTSLWSAYAVKPEMARSRGSEWRKLRTRGPGFGEKVRRGSVECILLCTRGIMHGLGLFCLFFCSAFFQGVNCFPNCHLLQARAL